eukprot:CAMPEP_0197576318 /NCGR_PEP_ID=MMETSP1326-20131121/1380_1 /TAXON_ID=1155430 /ORGANISM="Genus nov. species nov., Strain RCC2288" /LENGTH=200 /DNA_ID=CAMNT_0043139211 /DNA_START=303 /DNA_END=901 /DNA_ORIENTATION=+
MSNNVSSSFDPYGDLGLKRGATDVEVKAAFRRLAHLYHPDHTTSSGTNARLAAEHTFRRITAARERLLGPSASSAAAYAAGDPSHWSRGASSAAARAAGTSGPNNAAFAVVLMFPIVLMGFISQWAFPNDTEQGLAGGGGGSNLLGGDDMRMGRVNGFLEPPVNPWIRDDVLEAARKYDRDRPGVWTRISRRVNGVFGAG